MKRRLRAAGLCKTYRGRQVVKDVDLEVCSGEVIGLLGPNGAGKTTSFYMVVGLVRPDQGKIYLDDMELTDLPMYRRARAGISYLPQEASVFRKMTVEENLLAVLETMNLSVSERRERKEQLLEDLRSFFEDGVFLEFLLHQVDQFHPGELQKLDRLLELWRHHQLLAQFKLLADF